ncbi:MAG: hypothetical protein M1817_002207 [Caeruleum heppii]|nr:MAG: hypothetical protein M1817_002207 [Caeruleum heppii]
MDPALTHTPYHVSGPPPPPPGLVFGDPMAGPPGGMPPGHHHYPPPPPPPGPPSADRKRKASTANALPPPPNAPMGQEQPLEGQATATPPTAKKSRTNTPWTAAEEHRLKAMRDAGSSWSEIAKTFPTRTEGSVKKHWYKDMHYAEFAEDESQALLNAIKDYEASKWKVIGQKVGKPAKACEQYAKEHFAGKM